MWGAGLPRSCLGSCRWAPSVGVSSPRPHSAAMGGCAPHGLALGWRWRRRWWFLLRRRRRDGATLFVMRRRRRVGRGAWFLAITHSELLDLFAVLSCSHKLYHFYVPRSYNDLVYL